MTEGNCKINLALNVEGILPNGYHRIRSVMQEITLCDKISLSYGKSGLSLSCNTSRIPSDETNIAYKAAKLFFERSGISEGVHIHIEKQIPSQAGLGGGSTDGAVVLKELNRRFGFPFSSDELLAMGAKLGADVPFCILGKTALADGIGEILTPIESKIQCGVLIVKPDGGISTPWAYKRLDEKSFEPVNVDKVVEAVQSGNIKSLCENMGNVFESVATECVPEISRIKKLLLAHGAEGAMMSGSGTAIFALFTDDALLGKAYSFFKSSYPQTFTAKTVVAGEETIEQQTDLEI